LLGGDFIKSIGGQRIYAKRSFLHSGNALKIGSGRAKAHKQKERGNSSAFFLEMTDSATLNTGTWVFPVGNRRVRRQPEGFPARYIARRSRNHKGRVTTSDCLEVIASMRGKYRLEAYATLPHRRGLSNVEA
jgi:hypothetical protein